MEKGKLYWFPGTRVVGGISFVSRTPSCENGELDSPLVLDSGGHGTMTASRAVAATYGACPTCLVVAVQFPTSVPIVLPTGSDQPAREAITWTADQHDWIDVQSNSWGPFVPVWDPARAAGLIGATPEFVEDVETVSATQPAFWASGNGAAFRGGAVGHPTPLTPHATPSAVLVGGHDSGYVNTWPGFPPHLVSDSCDSWAAEHDSLDASGDTVGGGTSAATPFVAGGAAQILSEARGLLGDVTTGQDASGPDAVMAEGDPGDISGGPLADGVLTRAEWQPGSQIDRGALYDAPVPSPRRPGTVGDAAHLDRRAARTYRALGVDHRHVEVGIHEVAGVGVLRRRGILAAHEPGDAAADDSQFGAGRQGTPPDRGVRRGADRRQGRRSSLPRRPAPPA